MLGEHVHCMEVECWVNMFTLFSVSSTCAFCMGGVCVGRPGCSWNGSVSEQLPHREEQEWDTSVHLVSVYLKFLSPRLHATLSSHQAGGTFRAACCQLCTCW